MRDDGQKVLLATRNMGGEIAEARRAVLDDLTGRGLRRPDFLIVDGKTGLDEALAASWTDVPAQRCTIREHRNLPAHAPEKPRDEVTADHEDTICAETAAGIMARRKAFPRKWRLRHRPLADSLEEAGDRLSTFTHQPSSQRKSARTSNATRRLREEFKRRIQTRTVLPSSGTAAMLFSGSSGLRPAPGAQGRRLDLARHPDRPPARCARSPTRHHHAAPTRVTECQHVSRRYLVNSHALR